MQHELNVWCGFGDDERSALRHLAPAMETFYATPFERFARYCPHGRPSDVAEFLAEYAARGCRSFNLIDPDPDHGRAIEHVAEVAELLRRSSASTESASTTPARPPTHTTAAGASKLV